MTNQVYKDPNETIDPNTVLVYATRDEREKYKKDSCKVGFGFTYATSSIDGNVYFQEEMFHMFSDRGYSRTYPEGF